MSSATPCRLILCKSDCPNQGSTPYHRVQFAGHALPCPEQNANNSYPGMRNMAGRDFDNQLRTYENMARCQYSRLLNALSSERLPGWLDKMLNRRILPALDRIGFDGAISMGLFEIASSSWCRMGPANDKTIAFHPQIDREIEEVLRGLELTAGSVNGTLARPPGSAGAVFSGTINERKYPENLFALLDNIATPWIVLPRAFRFLEKDQARYLPAYLSTIEQEKRESFLMLFGRITIEFVGNFSLKFAARHHQPDKIAKLLFYGYTALFWKTLRCPPENLENSAAFDIFFNWLNRLACTNRFLGRAEATSIEQMKKMKMMIFPTRVVKSFRQPNRNNSSHFLITLRHGCMGTAGVLKYFGIDHFSEARQIRARFQSPSFQNDLQAFLHTIHQDCHLESKTTRGFINQFMDYLRSALEQAQQDSHPTKWDFLVRKISNIQILLTG